MTQASTKKNICSAFAATGIFPINSEKVLRKITATVPPPPSTPIRKSKLPTIPNSIRSLRRLVRTLRPLIKDVNVQNLVHASESLAARADIERQISDGLRKALVLMKKKQFKGEKLNIFGQESARPLLISPTKFSHLKAELDAKEQAKLQEEEEKELRKEEAKKRKIQTDMAKWEKSLQWQVILQPRRERKRFEEEQKTIKKVENKSKKLQRSASTRMAKKSGRKTQKGRSTNQTINLTVDIQKKKSIINQTIKSNIHKINKALSELDLYSQNNKTTKRPTQVVTIRFRNRRKLAQFRRIPQY